MNPMNDDRMFDLALKVIARQCSDAERGEFEARLSRQPELQAEFERLQADVRLAKDALPLVDAAQASGGELPGYARARLQTKVRQTLGRPEAAGTELDRSLAWGWRWWLGLAAAAAVALLLVPVLMSPSRPVVQVAILDIAGTVRGPNDADQALLESAWQAGAPQGFSDAAKLADWEQDWPASPKRPVVKVVYDRAAGEVRVLGLRQGRTFTKSFPVDPDLATALRRAKAYVDEEARR